MCLSGCEINARIATSLAREDFESVDLSEIHVYALDEGGQVCELEQLYINLYENHFSYIKDISHYCKLFCLFKL